MQNLTLHITRMQILILHIVALQNLTSYITVMQYSYYTSLQRRKILQRYQIQQIHLYSTLEYC